ncbi:glycosyltransferase family protein 28, putative [Babesia caballi]|uniref:Glycosyltransferase family protein 28, putative n=1 Tax=Babesia caballi TaxID=5871 RepID=A0AAV4LTT5_BABCB|nr:glycosyltransferase family protein 28, putative [Babesia caballi]
MHEDTQRGAANEVSGSSLLLKGSRRYLEERKTRYFGYEAETLRFILPMLEECDRRVQRGRVRAEEDVAGKQTTLDDATIEEAKRIDAEIEKKMNIANELGMKGDVEESFKVLEEAELLKKNKLDMLEKAGEASYQSRIKPCDICGALLSATDTDRRLTEHYSGKIHVSYQKLRDMSKLLTEYINERKGERAGRTAAGNRRAAIEAAGRARAAPAGAKASAAARRGTDVADAIAAVKFGGGGVKTKQKVGPGERPEVIRWPVGMVAPWNAEVAVRQWETGTYSAAAAVATLPMARRVLVTVGTTSFDGLIAAVDDAETQLELKRLGYTDICYQIGESARQIQHEILRTRVVRFAKDFDALLRESELVISHMGAGTILDVFRLRKKALFVPNNQLADDHQMQLFRVMDERYRSTLGSIREKLAIAAETPGDFFARLLPAGQFNDVVTRTIWP